MKISEKTDSKIEKILTVLSIVIGVAVAIYWTATDYNGSATALGNEFLSVIWYMAVCPVLVGGCIFLVKHMIFDRD